MKVAIIGTGYVGLPTGIGLAELGNTVVCVDKIAEKVEALSAGKATIYEDGMEELFQKHLKSGALSFTLDMVRTWLCLRSARRRIRLPKKPI